MENAVKYNNYATLKTQLRKALACQFYLQAVFIEYAIFEDRTESVLRHAGDIKLTNSRGNPLKLSEKINKICSCAAFSKPQIRRQLPLELMNQIVEWKRLRDRQTHALLNNPIDMDQLEQLALDGERLMKFLDNGVKTVNRLFDKAHSQTELN